MKYFILYFSSNPKEIGSDFPQVELAEPMANVTRLGQYLSDPIPATFQIPSLKLKYRAKLTDFIRSSLSHN